MDGTWDAEAGVSLADELLMGRGDADPDPEAARELYEKAAATGSALGARRAATFAALGVARDQNWGEALDYVTTAAVAGDRHAQRQLLLLSDARDEGGKGAAVWKRLRGEIDIETWLTPPAAQQISAAPVLLAIPGFAPRAVCRWLIQRSADKLGVSMINDSVSGQLTPHPTRTALSFAFKLFETDLIALTMQERLARACKISVHHHEAPAVLSYTIGQEYQAHYDFVELPTFAMEVEFLGQRVATCLTYLNDDYTGGETHFPRLDLRWRGKAGDALLFWNVKQNREPDPMTLHAGLPPSKGRKWLLSQWVRDQVQPIL